MNVKPGASIDKCRAPILVAAQKIEPLFPNGMVITSGSEKYKHSAERSAHYRGDAIDVRIKNVTEIDRPELLRQIKQALGPDYVVIWEGKGLPWEHIHIHWSPVYHD